jgi:CubicO group peptidase (beta-lactamase class C family)
VTESPYRCCLQAALRNYARFGQFVLDGGRIAGRPTVPEGWFEEWWVLGEGTFAAMNSAWPEAAGAQRSQARKGFLQLITDALDVGSRH